MRVLKKYFLNTKYTFLTPSYANTFDLSKIPRKIGISQLRLFQE